MHSTATPTPVRAEAALRIAFQPVADTSARRVYAQEASLRGPRGESAEQLLATLPPEGRRDFDRKSIHAAVRSAVALGIVTSGARLILPVHVETVEDVAEHLDPAVTAARNYGMVAERLIFALHNYQEVPGPHLAEMVGFIGKLGSFVAFVGLGPANAGLGLCGRYSPDAVKLESELVSGIASSWSRRLMLEELAPRIRRLGLKTIASGVDGDGVLQRLVGFGIHLVQGELIGRAELGALPALAPQPVH